LPTTLCLCEAIYHILEGRTRCKIPGETVGTIVREALDEAVGETAGTGPVAAAAVAAAIVVAAASMKPRRNAAFAAISGEFGDIAIQSDQVVVQLQVVETKFFSCHGDVQREGVYRGQVQWLDSMSECMERERDIEERRGVPEEGPEDPLGTVGLCGVEVCEGARESVGESVGVCGRKSSVKKQGFDHAHLVRLCEGA
jgi:hypothetical protein